MNKPRKIILLGRNGSLYVFFRSKWAKAKDLKGIKIINSIVSFAQYGF